MSWWLRCMLVACVTHGLDAAGALAGLRGNAHKRAAALDLADVQEAARLEDLFEVYSLRHARCATDADSACQYVLVTTNTVRGGLGNRLPSLVTGLLLALLTRCPPLPTEPPWWSRVNVSALTESTSPYSLYCSAAQASVLEAGRHW